MIKPPTFTITILNKTTRHGGGASRMGETHSKALQHAGVKNTFHIRYKQGSWVQRVSEKVALRLLLNLPWRPKILSESLIHLHDHWSTIDPFSIIRLARTSPVCITLHDCSAFTGGCLYPYNCNQFCSTQGCASSKACPQARFSFIPRHNHETKRHHFPTLPVFASAPSQWMANLADSSGVFRAPTRVIRYFVSTVFTPVTLQPTNIPSVLIGAASLSDPRKGGTYLPTILTLLHQKVPFSLRIFGKELPPWVPTLGIPFTFLGYLSTEEALAQAYQQADVYVFPSITDNSPLTVIESLRCGTPVFCWNTGGTPELFNFGQSGWHAPLGDTALLVAYLAAYLQLSPSNRQIHRTYAIRDSEQFNETRYIQEHIQWYETCRSQFLS